MRRGPRPKRAGNAHQLAADQHRHYHGERAQVDRLARQHRGKDEGVQNLHYAIKSQDQEEMRRSRDNTQKQRRNSRHHRPEVKDDIQNPRQDAEQQGERYPQE